MLSTPGRLKFSVSCTEHYPVGIPFERGCLGKLIFENETQAPLQLELKSLYRQNLRTKEFDQVRISDEQFVNYPWWVPPGGVIEVDFSAGFSLKKAASSAAAVDDYQLTMVVGDHFNEAHTISFVLKPAIIAASVRFTK